MGIPIGSRAGFVEGRLSFVISGRLGMIDHGYSADRTPTFPVGNEDWGGRWGSTDGTGPASEPRPFIRLPEISTTRSEATLAIVDMTETTFVDSTVINWLLRTKNILQEKNGGLRVVAPPEGLVARLVALTRLEGVIEVLPTLQEAMAAMSDQEALPVGQGITSRYPTSPNRATD